jgi:hypothetical protein
MPGRKKSLLESLTGRGGEAEIAAGQRFQKPGVPWVVWEVASLFEGNDGMIYVQLVRVDDRSMKKTVSREVLERGVDYRRLTR